AGRRRVRAVEALDRVAERVAAACGRLHRSRSRLVRLEYRAAGVGEARAALRAGRRVGIERQGEWPQRLEGRRGVPAGEIATPQVRGAAVLREALASVADDGQQIAVAQRRGCA